MNIRIAAFAGMVAIILTAIILSQGCAKRVPASAPVPRTDPAALPAVVSVSQVAPLNPFVCSISQQQLVCIALVDVRFRRGQRETEIARGHQFSFTAPKGTGNGTVWFGCAATNSCEGYFMFGSPKVTVTPTPPARFWQGGSDVLVPFGSLGIVEVSVNNSMFESVRNRWSGSIAQPVMQAGPGTVITCTDDVCTVGVK